MRTQVKILLTIVVMSSLLGPARLAFADIFVDTNLTLGGDVIFGDCNINISTSAPYTHFSGDCDLDKNDIRIAGHPISNIEIGFPRSVIWTRIWILLKPGAPQANAVYCAKFGEYYAPEDALFLSFEHYLHEDLDAEIVGHETCKTAVPQVKAYYQTQCLGAFVWVFRVESLVPGLHLSYREVGAPLACWAVATFPGGN